MGAERSGINRAKRDESVSVQLMKGLSQNADELGRRLERLSETTDQRLKEIAAEFPVAGLDDYLAGR